MKPRALSVYQKSWFEFSEIALAQCSGHFGPTDQIDQTGQSGPPVKLFPNIPVGPDRNGPFHLMWPRLGPKRPGYRFIIIIKALGL